MSDRRAPVQLPYEARRKEPAVTISWQAHLLAWKAYEAAGHGSQSAERLAERGGFGRGELRACWKGDYHNHGNYAEMERWSKTPWTPEEIDKYDVRSVKPPTPGEESGT